MTGLETYLFTALPREVPGEGDNPSDKRDRELRAVDGPTTSEEIGNSLESVFGRTRLM